MRLLIICFFAFNLHYSALSQNGFLGKQTQLEISVLGNTPVFSGLFKNKNYFRINDRMISSRDYLDMGFCFQVTFATSKRFSFGANCTFKLFEVYADSVLSDFFSNSLIGDYEISSDLRMESPRFNCVSFLPILSIAPKGSYAGVGVSHDFGLGFSLSYFRNKAYYMQSGKDENPSNDIDIYYYSMDWPPFQSLTARYGTHIAIPLNNSIHFKFGFVSILNIYYKPKFENIQSIEQGIFNYEDLFYNVQRENLFTWNLNTGVVFQL